MGISHRISLAFASLALSAVVAGCSGATTSAGDPGQTSSSSRSAGEPGQSSSTGRGSSTSDSCAACSSNPDAPRDASPSCVNLVASPADLACEKDDDCTPVVVGQVCPGFVPTVGDHLGTLCINAAANSAGAARLSAAQLAIPHGEDAGHDFCDIEVGPARCIARACVLCGAVGLGGPDGKCGDAGPAQADATGPG